MLNFAWMLLLSSFTGRDLKLAEISHAIRADDMLAFQPFLNMFRGMC